ncbi:MAG: RsbRD N-terminal domain-containing protein [Deltaproteobacteria bacterium]
MPSVPRATRQAIAGRWLAEIFATYPDQTAQFLIRERDPFRNPVGTALREAIPTLVDELFESTDAATVARALEGVIRIRAVQDFSASEAVGFIFLLKSAVGAEWPPETGMPADLDRRVDEIALAAFDLYARCREQVFEVRLREAGRRSEMLQKIRAREEETVRKP